MSNLRQEIDNYDQQRTGPNTAYGQQNQYENPHMKSVEALQTTVPKPLDIDNWQEKAAINDVTGSDWAQVQASMIRPQAPKELDMRHAAAGQGRTAPGSLSRTATVYNAALNDAYSRNVDAYNRGITDIHGNLTNLEQNRRSLRSSERQSQMDIYKNYMNNMGQIANSGVLAGVQARGQDIDYKTEGEKLRAAIAENQANRQQDVWTAWNRMRADLGEAPMYAVASNNPNALRTGSEQEPGTTNLTLAQEAGMRRQMSTQDPMYNRFVSESERDRQDLVRDAQRSQSQRLIGAPASNTTGGPQVDPVTGMTVMPEMQNAVARNRFKEHANQYGIVSALNRYGDNVTPEMRDAEEFRAIQEGVNKLVASSVVDDTWFGWLPGVTHNEQRKTMPDLTGFYESLKDMNSAQRKAAVKDLITGGGSPATRTWFENKMMDNFGPRGLLSFNSVADDHSRIKSPDGSNTYRYANLDPAVLAELYIGGEKGKGGSSMLELAQYLGLMPSTQDVAAAEANRAAAAQEQLKAAGSYVRDRAAANGVKFPWSVPNYWVDNLPPRLVPADNPLPVPADNPLPVPDDGPWPVPN